jgi:hypothetical protein
MKGIFKSKPRTPAELVRATRELLAFVDTSPVSRETKKEEKVCSFAFDPHPPYMNSLMGMCVRKSYVHMCPDVSLYALYICLAIYFMHICCYLCILVLCVCMCACMHACFQCLHVCAIHVVCVWIYLENNSTVEHQFGN